MTNTKRKPKRELTRKKHEIKRVEKGYFAPGISANPAGRPKGSKGFETYLWEAAEKVAKDQAQKTGKKIRAEEIMSSLYVVALAQAKSGNFNFYNDIMDRLHGKPVISAEIEHSNKFEGYSKEQLVEFIIDKIASVK